MKHARDDYNLRIQDTLPPEAGGIPTDEPVFLLRAQDALAPMAMEAWIRGLEHHGGAPETLAAARLHLDRFHDWQTEHGAKIPDAPAAELQSVIDRDASARSELEDFGGVSGAAAIELGDVSPEDAAEIARRADAADASLRERAQRTRAYQHEDGSAANDGEE